MKIRSTLSISDCSEINLLKAKSSQQSVKS